MTRRAASSVGDALRAYGEELAASGDAQVGAGFSSDPAADRLVKVCPEAFLLGVLFTQGIPAERAWAAPHLLKERLGHLDLMRLASEENAVAAAVAAPPALHRFVATVPHWIVSAACRLLAEYGGDASRIWPDGAHVADVTGRLLAFDGIGGKKAAMAVGILIRHFHVPLTGLECSAVAYDVHVRRVFLRSGLIAADTPESVRMAAGTVYPESPVTLDLAAWLIGRDTCGPAAPLCEDCRLGAVCPRLIDRNVEGVGVRGSQVKGI